MRHRGIHIVYPQNPCCLRTCINDFTYTKENVNDIQIKLDNIKNILIKIFILRQNVIFV